MNVDIDAVVGSEAVPTDKVLTRGSVMRPKPLLVTPWQVTVRRTVDVARSTQLCPPLLVQL